MTTTTKTTKTKSATKTRMAGHEGPGLHYKHIRTTCTILLASTQFAKVDECVRACVLALVEINFDVSRLADAHVEALTMLDDELLAAARAEFEFVPARGAIRDHGEHVGHCALCGKGDSKRGEGEENRDKLRYDFRLANVAGGSDLYVGADCIVNFGLKVRGAETSAEARALLERTLREHIAIWKVETWRAEHADHADIPALSGTLTDRLFPWKYYGRFGRRSEDIRLLGQEQHRIYSALTSAARAMRTCTRFYQRKGALTPQKTAEWRGARGLAKSLTWIESVLDATERLQGAERTAALIAAREKRERLLAAMKRTPRRL